VGTGESWGPSFLDRKRTQVFLLLEIDLVESYCRVMVRCLGIGGVDRLLVHDTIRSFPLL
jgi:hypothetical protein